MINEHISRRGGNGVDPDLSLMINEHRSRRGGNGVDPDLSVR